MAARHAPGVRLAAGLPLAATRRAYNRGTAMTSRAPGSPDPAPPGVEVTGLLPAAGDRRGVS
jgi:hypothetical protein